MSAGTATAIARPQLVRRQPPPQSSGEIKLHDPLASGSGGFLGYPKQFLTLIKNQCFSGEAEIRFVFEILEEIYGHRTKDQRGVVEPPKAWTDPYTDKRVAELAGCDLRTASEIKWHLYESGILDARRQGNSWQFSPHGRVRGWKNVPKWTPPEKKPVESADTGENEGEETAKRVCSILQSPAKIAPGKAWSFRLPETGQTIKARNQSRDVGVECSVARATGQLVELLILPLVPAVEKSPAPPGASANTSPPPSPEIPQQGANKKSLSSSKLNANQQFGSLLQAIQNAGMRHTDAEVSRATGEVWRAFFALPFSERVSAIQGIHRRVQCGQYQPHNPEFARFIPRALKYLRKRLWTEALMPYVPRKTSGKPTTDWDAIRRSLK